MVFVTLLHAGADLAHRADNHPSNLGESSMSPRTSLLSAFTLGTVLSFGTAANAGDLPQQGTYNATYTSSGMVKAIPVGKERVLLIISDEHGETQADGFLDHMVWLCWGLGDFTNGLGKDHGSCVATDPSGDQIVDDWSTEEYKLGQTTIKSR
jgi:hypothetical protein